MLDSQQDNDLDLMATIEEARDLRRSDEYEKSQALLLDLMDKNPDHPLVLFEVGGSYDVLGEEEMAIPYYRQAIASGLDGDDLQECLVCLGSSLRVMGETEEAVSILEQAVDEFPERNSGRVFLALAQFSNGEIEQAVSNLLSLLLKTTSDEDILAYADTFSYYVDNLDNE
ncbi:MAG: tetratricopeptide repeat protein [Candidatus Promineofilum sp.]|nr:tetratricopeptide repeat protein [Promineifilum sp.]MBP9656776.1 tetratricopeptide repeat protein [Promineifilum sp.]